MNSCYLRKLLTVFLILFLAACGGGGKSLDGSDSGGDTGDAGSGGSGGEAAINISAQLYHCSDDATPPSSSCEETSNISQVAPGILQITATTDDGSTPIKDAFVSVELERSLGVLIPEAGTVITDSEGIALVTLLAGSDPGADQYTVTIQGETLTKAFNIGAIDEDGINIEATDGLNGAILNAGSSTVIEVKVSDSNGEPFPTPLNVELSSSCISDNTASIDSPAITVNGVAHATYTAKGCVGQDRVFITIATGGQSFNASHPITVSPAKVGAIEFVSVSNDFIAIQQAGGLGRPTSSVVTFRLLDENTNPVSNQEIQFALNTGNGGVSIDPQVGFTNADGIVTTTVTSGTVPTPVRITASYAETGNPTISQVSDGINIGTGLADNNSFTLAVETHNLEALNLAGTETEVTAFAADHFNNPVPDGTTVQFTTEGGAIFPPSCQTVNGTCSVTWRSQDPRPLSGAKVYLSNGRLATDGTGSLYLSDTDPRLGDNFDTVNTIIDARCGEGTFYGYGPCLNGEIKPTGTASTGPQGGRANILAFMLGEESFADINNNGLYDPGEFFVPLDDAYVDHNENGQFDGNKQALNSAINGVSLNGGELEEFFDSPIPSRQDGKYTYAANSLELIEDLFPSTDCPVVVDNGEERHVCYQGTLCSPAALDAGHCTVKAVHARRNNLIVMSGSNAYFRVLEGAADSDGLLDVRTPASKTDSARIYISDIYNNPMPAGSTITVTARDVDLLTDGSFEYPNTTGVWSFGVTVKAPDDPEGDGFVTVTITTPSGVATRIGINVDVVN